MFQIGKDSQDQRVKMKQLMTTTISQTIELHRFNLMVEMFLLRVQLQQCSQTKDSSVEDLEVTKPNKKRKRQSMSQLLTK